MESLKHTKNQSNPFSTGGGGATYETKVITHFVLSLLRGTSAPIFKGSTIENVELQTRHLGYDIDDLLIHACDLSKVQHRILCQVKHNFSIAASDKDFVETFSAAWHDFNDISIFDKGRDAIAIITTSLASIDSNHSRVLFSWARKSNSACDFFKRVSLLGFSSTTKQQKLDTIRNLITAQSSSPISDEMFWEFMKSIHILNYDLEDDSPLLQSIIDQSNSVLGEIILFVEQTNQEAGRICRENIPESIHSAFSDLLKDQLSNDIQRIHEHNSSILGIISEKIANTHVDRDDCISDINDILRSYGAAFLSGNRGCGKSALVKAYSETQGNVFFLIFRAEELDSASLHSSLSEIGIHSTLSQLSDYFRLYENKIVIIESLEKIHEASNTAAFQELLSFAKMHNWKILASIRDYAWNAFCFHFLGFEAVTYR
ncbi:MAG: hypothetical protein CVV04_11545 [Firmicutes bacterium HGW-Firmicutes-9]|jgi:hypothetical protein|nr:MAG: hypothetical protein CVV04_11545 [Firmicutes bacterium HGW-Firmicutes-9]